MFDTLQTPNLARSLNPSAFTSHITMSLVISQLYIACSYLTFTLYVPLLFVFRSSSCWPPLKAPVAHLLALHIDLF